MKTQYLNSLPEAWLPVAKIFAALGDPTRQKILLLFEHGEELSIKQIVEAFGSSRTTIVHHLTVLESSGVLRVRRSGREALYSVDEQVVLNALEALRIHIHEEFLNLPESKA